MVDKSLNEHSLMAQGYMTSVFVFLSFFWLVMNFCYFANLFQRRKTCELNPLKTVCNNLHFSISVFSLSISILENALVQHTIIDLN